MNVQIGIPLPLGAFECCGGVNFALFSRHATRVTLLLFDELSDTEPKSVVALDNTRHRTGDIWHVRLHGVGVRLIYAWQVDGPFAPELGHRFNPNRVLLDPYAIALVGTDCWDFGCACGFDSTSTNQDLSLSLRNNFATQPKCLAVTDSFDWEGDHSPNHSWSDTIIYETHIRGLTIDPSSMVKCPGTYLGLIEKIPYFKELGITAIELMPVQEFYENELTRRDPQSKESLRNYWGYNTVAFFSPKESYSTRKKLGCQLGEFKAMVKALHKAGIEVILDIVFNHTAEGNETGPTLNFRGLDNSIYYLLENNLRFYKNYSGTGNTLNCNHPVVRDFILDCLRHWVIEMHVDGFRFDLASILGRDEKGKLMLNPPLLERIAEDPVLRGVKLIAEAWDAGGAYQVGHFPGKRWSEWNGRFRDDVRRFWRGDAGYAGALASRIAGSADIYQQDDKEPVNSINFVCCHDGFTLNDLVSYCQKHNLSNDENNNDGNRDEFSANYGVEGITTDSAIDVLRLRQIKNFIATLLIARGVPMLLGGDEFRRTQYGNNNSYCQDNVISWYNWNYLKKHQDIFEFTKKMIALRKQHINLRAERFYTEDEILWFDPSGRYPFWDRLGNAFGCIIKSLENAQSTLCLLFNAELKSVEFQLPKAIEQERWNVVVDTSLTSLKSVSLPESADTYVLADRSFSFLRHNCSDEF